MEATMFSHWIYWHLKPHAAELKMGYPARMKAISAGKNKSDKIDTRTISDLLRCNLLPECFVISPELGALRQQLRFRRLMIEQQVMFKNKTAGLLMEAGVEYERKRLHGKRYFAELLAQSEWIGNQMRPLLDRRLLRMLERHPRLQARIECLQQIDGVGPVTALTWALEVGTPERFGCLKKAMSYCGLTSAFRESAGKQKRGPISKQRNRHLPRLVATAAAVVDGFPPDPTEPRFGKQPGCYATSLLFWGWRV